MRLFNITTIYPAYIKYFYAKNNACQHKLYAEQKAALIYDGCSWFDFWRHALQPYGYIVEESLANIWPLQSAWAREHELKISKKHWQKEIVLEQIKAFQPDILFLEYWAFFSKEEVAEIRQIVPSIRLVVSWCGAPYKDPNIFKAHDLVLSCIPELVEEFRALGHRSKHIHHAFDPRILDRLRKANEPSLDVSFVGQIERGSKKHSSRELLLEYLAPRLPLQIFTPSADVRWQDYLKSIIKKSGYGANQVLKNIGISEKELSKLPGFQQINSWKSPPLLPVNPKLKPFLRSPVFGLEMFQTLQRSRISLNSHIDASRKSASNMRLFEATGVGTCLVTDYKENLPSLFFPDQEIVTYSSVEECTEKVRWLLNNPKRCQEIGQAGKSRTCREHTFIQRAIRLNEIIQSTLERI
jgi:spore maturation protein CgeB